MTQLGVGAMIHMLAGGSPHAPSKYAGLTITAADFSSEALLLSFSNGQRIKIFDDGQSCCESRYMTTDDDTASLVGHKLLRIDAKDGPEDVGEYGDRHETCFVEVATDGGFITITTHNEHNGYYGGFGLSIHEITD